MGSHCPLWKTDWSQLKQSSTAFITCLSVCLIFKAVCLISISNVDRGNRNLSPGQTDPTVVLSRRELRVGLRSQSTPCPPCSRLCLTEAAVYWMFQRAARKGSSFSTVLRQCPGAAAVRKGQSCPVLGTAGSSQLYSVMSTVWGVPVRYSVRSEGKRQRNNAADTKVREGEGRRHWSRYNPAACGRHHGGADISYEGSHRKLTPVESPCGAILP